MGSGEVLARVAVHQEQESTNFKFDSFIKREMYYENYPEEKKEYQERMSKKRKKQGKDSTLAEEFVALKGEKGN